jgi:hypothetical protein
MTWLPGVKVGPPRAASAQDDTLAIPNIWACTTAISTARDDALPTKADRWVVDTRARDLDDKLVSRIGLDRLPVDQALGFL